VLELGKLSLVDDIVNIHSLGGELEQKARFLQKTKSFLRENAATATSKTSSKQHSSRQRMLHIVRRTLDVSIALLLFILLLPLMLVIMILIKLESQGPVIYCSKRAGKGCRIFDFYKFRTMRANAEKYMSVVESLNAYDLQRNKPLFFKALNDPRITRFGAFLRNTSLDELPQLINVIKGDMSLVGNRPLPLYEASTLTNDLWAERFMAPAGITGLWQVLKRGNKQMCLEERLNLDITYARQHNFSRDCWILANTPRALFQKMTM
jgi:lipopolysaccharide/colanic/teichoic acid biosynthesis glycosyltransferase